MSGLTTQHAEIELMRRGQSCTVPYSDEVYELLVREFRTVRHEDVGSRLVRRETPLVWTASSH